MARISIGRLRAAAAQPREQAARSKEEARNIGLKTAFLCHSHHDGQLVIGLVSLLRQAGWNVYVDWQDASMPQTPNRETARKIKERIATATYFLFLATANSTSSRWCPWEIGYADGVKPIDNILIVPTQGDNSEYYGNEYLQLYRRIELSDDGQLASWQPGRTTDGVYVRNL